MKNKILLLSLTIISMHPASAEEIINDDLRVNGGLTIDDNSSLSLRNTQGDGTYSIHYANVAPRYPLRFVGSADPNTNRFFEFGHYTGENQSNTWNPEVIINGYNGNVGIGTTSTTEQLVIGSSADSPNIRLSRWAFFGQETSHLTTVLGGNAKAYGSNTVVAETTVDGYRAIRMRYDQGITFHAFKGSVTAGDTVGNERMRITPTGNVGIGTATPGTYKLAVNGTVRAKEVIIDTGWSDFVFEDGYFLRPLKEVESHILEYGHLPEVPSAGDIESDGLSVGEAQKIMMQKIEELTLYVIELEKRSQSQQRLIESQHKEIESLKVR